MIRLEISLKAGAGVAKRGVWGKERLVWNCMAASVHLHLCSSGNVRLKQVECLQRYVSIWPYFWLKMEFC